MTFFLLFGAKLGGGRMGVCKGECVLFLGGKIKGSVLVIRGSGNS